MDITAHLKRSRHGVFYCGYLIRTPDSAGPVQFRELTYSLNTKLRRVALALSYPINATVIAAFTRARVRGKSHEATRMDLRNELHQWTATFDLRKRLLTVSADPRIPGDRREAVLRGAPPRWAVMNPSITA
jgi:hypothetical protein